MAGLNDVEYFAQSMYEPDVFIVPGFNPGMPVINKPPIGLTDQEILCVIAYLQTLGGTATVTLQTKHRYYGGAAAPAPAGLPAPATPGPGDKPAEKLPLVRPAEGREAMKIPVVLAVLVVFGLLRFRRAGLLLWAAVWLVGHLRPPAIWIHRSDSQLRHLAVHGNRYDCDPGLRVLQRGPPRRSLRARSFD